jgi:hypothetical protein
MAAAVMLVPTPVPGPGAAAEGAPPSRRSSSAWALASLETSARRAARSLATLESGR